MIGDFELISNAERTSFHWEGQIAGRMPMWTVTRPSTLDYPGQWCARMVLTLPVLVTTRIVIVRQSLEEIHAALPEGLVCMPRSPEDDAVIEETWL